MARAPETGFYFEPIAERLALVVEGSPFPSDDHWAWLGDPIAMTPEQAQLLVGVRWPGVDPGSLEVEFDLNFQRAVAAKEADDAEKRAGVAHVPLEFDIDLEQLFEQAELLRERAASLDSPSPATHDAAREAAHLAELVARARALAEPRVPGRVLAVEAAPPQSNDLLQAARPALPPAPPAPAPVLIPEIVPPSPKEPPPRKHAPMAPKLKPQAAPVRPAAAAKSAPLPEPPKPETPAARPAPRRPNIRDKR